MKRGLTIVALTLGAASPAAAQLAGMPVWNTPSGGTGVTISADYGKPNNSGGGGNAFGARASLGLANLNLTAGIASWKPNNASNSLTSFGGDVAFRVIGGSLIPLSVNLQGGASHTTATGLPDITAVIGALGISINVPTPGLSIEPYVAPGIRYSKSSQSGIFPSTSSTNFGFAIGANLGLGMLGFHVAYDYTKVSGGNVSVIGLGAHVALKAPMGM
jgi:opacity protein-like surface antigen